MKTRIWKNVKDEPFPKATTNEYRRLVVTTHRCHTLAVHCAWDHTGEYQPIFGPNWYYWNGHSMVPLDVSTVDLWMVLPDRNDVVDTGVARRLSDDEIKNIIADELSSERPTDDELIDLIRAVIKKMED